MTQLTIQDEVLSVVGLQVHSDLLPEAGPLWGERGLEEAARELASFVSYSVGADRIQEAAQLLLALAQDRQGPLVQVLTQISLLEWRHERAPWSQLQELLRATAQVLERRDGQGSAS